MSDPLDPVDERLADWVDGRMTERERARFEGELRVSPKLRADLGEYERTVAALRAAWDAPMAGVELADRVLERLAHGASVASARPQGSGRSRWIWSLAAAAALLGFALWIDRWSAPQPLQDTVALQQAEDALRETTKPVSDPDASAPPLHELAKPGGGRRAESAVPEAKTQGTFGETVAVPTGASGSAPTEAKPDGAVAIVPEASGSSTRKESSPAAQDKQLGRSIEPLAPAGGFEKKSSEDAGPKFGNTALDDAKTDTGRIALPVVELDGVAAPLATKPADPTGTGAKDDESRKDKAATARGAVPRGSGNVGAAKSGNPEPVLRGEALHAEVDAFLLQAVASESASARWQTELGAVQIAPLPAQADVPDQAGDGEVARESQWLVEGPRDDLARILVRVAEFARARTWRVQSGEVLVPARPATEELRRDPVLAEASPTGASSSPPTAAVGTRLVLRFRLRRQ